MSEAVERKEIDKAYAKAAALASNKEQIDSMLEGKEKSVRLNAAEDFADKEYTREVMSEETQAVLGELINEYEAEPGDVTTNEFEVDGTPYTGETAVFTGPDVTFAVTKRFNKAGEQDLWDAQITPSHPIGAQAQRIEQMAQANRY